jgi:hypothetical protein
MSSAVQLREIVWLALPPSPNHIDSRIVVRGPGCV